MIIYTLSTYNRNYKEFDGMAIRLLCRRLNNPVILPLITCCSIIDRTGIRCRRFLGGEEFYFTYKKTSN